MPVNRSGGARPPGNRPAATRSEKPRPTNGSRVGPLLDEASRSEPNPEIELGASAYAAAIDALQKSGTELPPVDAERVAQLRQAIRDGTYEINPDQIARKMIELERLLD